MQFKEAIDQFSGWRKFKVKSQTVRGYDQTLRQFYLFLRNPEIEDITINHVMDYLNGMKDMGWDTNSFVGKYMALRKFFEFYRLQGYSVINEELIPIMQAERKLPRVATVREALEKKNKFKDRDAIFISIANAQSGQRYSIRGVGEMLRKYSARAKISYMNAHSFRHRVGHHIIKNGGSSADVMNILGHSSVQSTTIYTMMSDHELEKRYRYFMEEPAQEKSRVARELPPVGKSA